jgi:arginyl-tRNA synthetase
LAQEFNKFYENNRVKDDPRETLRAEIVKSYARILKTGLELLHIPAPEYM